MRFAFPAERRTSYKEPLSAEEVELPERAL